MTSVSSTNSVNNSSTTDFSNENTPDPKTRADVKAPQGWFSRSVAWIANFFSDRIANDIREKSFGAILKSFIQYINPFADAVVTQVQGDENKAPQELIKNLQSSLSRSTSENSVEDEKAVGQLNGDYTNLTLTFKNHNNISRKMKELEDLKKSLASIKANIDLAQQPNNPVFRGTLPKLSDYQEKKLTIEKQMLEIETEIVQLKKNPLAPQA